MHLKNRFIITLLKIFILLVGNQFALEERLLPDLLFVQVGNVDLFQLQLTFCVGKLQRRRIGLHFQERLAGLHKCPDIGIDLTNDSRNLGFHGNLVLRLNGADGEGLVNDRSLRGLDAR